jgi:hypothetical protein
MERMIEALVLLKSKAGAADQVGHSFALAASLPPRLLVVRLTPERVEELRAHESVAAVALDVTALAQLKLISEAERLFAAGWAARGAKSAPRTGQGLHWDADGKLPPGRPKS